MDVSPGSCVIGDMGIVTGRISIWVTSHGGMDVTTGIWVAGGTDVITDIWVASHSGIDVTAPATGVDVTAGIWIAGGMDDSPRSWVISDMGFMTVRNSLWVTSRSGMDFTTGNNHSGMYVTTGIWVHLGHQPQRHGRHDRYQPQRHRRHDRYLGPSGSPATAAWTSRPVSGSPVAWTSSRAAGSSATRDS